MQPSSSASIPSTESHSVKARNVPHASPRARRLARELGIDLQQLEGSERAGRISIEDVRRQFDRVARSDASVASAPPKPAVSTDFGKFGVIEIQPLTRFRKLSGARLARSWAIIPQVTHHDHADITNLEGLRATLNKESERSRTRLTLLAFLMKASAAALKEFPDFNASLSATGDTLTLRKYVHIGFAADTQEGLLVPVVRDVDKKGVLEIAREIHELATKARNGQLGLAEMSGGCFSVASLGSIGGTAFTPLVNAPEVAILGASKSQIRPVWNSQAFEPRLMLPLSLSYDHRVIDGALAARFVTYLARLLADSRLLL